MPLQPWQYDQFRKKAIPGVTRSPTAIMPPNQQEPGLGMRRPSPVGEQAVPAGLSMRVPGLATAMMAGVLGAPPSKYAGRPGYREVKPQTPGTRAFVGPGGVMSAEQTTPTGMNFLQPQYYESARRGIDSLGRNIVPGYSPLAGRVPQAAPASIPGPSGTQGLGQTYQPTPPPTIAPQANDPLGHPAASPTRRMYTPMMNTAGAAVAPLNPSSTGNMIRERINGANAEAAERSQDMQGVQDRLRSGIAQGQQDQQDRQAAFDARWSGINNQLQRNNLTPQHLGASIGGPTESNRQMADFVLQGNSAQPRYGASVGDPRFAGMNSRFGAGAPMGLGTAPESRGLGGGQPPERPKNGYDLRTGHEGDDRRLNLQTRMPDRDASGIENGTIGMYGNGSSMLMRQNGRNILVGNHKIESEDGMTAPERIAAGESPRSIIRQAQSRDTTNRLMQQAKVHGIDTDSADWRSQTLAKNRQAFLSNKEAKQQQRMVARAVGLGVSGAGQAMRGGGGTMRRGGAAMRQAVQQALGATMNPGTAAQASTTPEKVPLDTAAGIMNKYGNGGGVLGLLGLSGYDSLHDVPAHKLAEAMDSDAYRSLSPAAQQQFNNAAGAWHSVKSVGRKSHPTTDSLFDEISKRAKGQTKEANAIRDQRKKSRDAAITQGLGDATVAAP